VHLVCAYFGPSLASKGSCLLRKAMDSRNSTQSEGEWEFTHWLLEWYSANARTMPWRVSPAEHRAGVRPNPYHTWLSEVMLQQTQVKTVISYFETFIGIWPSVADLAAAPEADVMGAWAGLGYYSRARNLMKCAQAIMCEHGGAFPSDHAALLALPGVGDYTAAAIAAIAFDIPIPVVDGNIERVISRQTMLDTPMPKGKAAIKAHLKTLMPFGQPGEFAQALMDLGATICTPKRPACAICPVRETCLAQKSGRQEEFPVKVPKREKPLRRGAAFVALNGTGQIWLRRRPASGLLGGMSEVPTTDWTSRADGARGAAAAPFAAQWKATGSVRHTFTHFHLELEIWKAEEVKTASGQGWWQDRDKLQGEALPTLMRKVLSVALDE